MQGRDRDRTRSGSGKTPRPHRPGSRSTTAQPKPVSSSLEVSAEVKEHERSVPDRVVSRGDGTSVGVRCGDAYGARYRLLRSYVLARNGGRCCFCGLRAAEEAHHSALRYPCGRDGPCCGLRKVTASDLVGLCRLCHGLATTLRRFHRAGGSMYEFVARFKKVIVQCGIRPPYGLLAPSSLTNERPDWTPDPLPTSRRLGSLRKEMGTGPKPTISTSANLSVPRVFRSTRAERLRSLQERFGPTSNAPPANSAKDL